MLEAITSLVDPSVVTPLAHAFSSSIYVNGLLMILLNTGTAYLMQDIMPLANRVFAVVWMRRLVFFAIFFTATRHLWISLLLTLLCTLLIDVLLNEKSAFCLLPYEWREDVREADQIETFANRRPPGQGASPVRDSRSDSPSRQDVFRTNAQRWDATHSLHRGIRLA